MVKVEDYNQHLGRVNYSEDAIPDQTGKVVLVTGGNSGIGKETCRVLLSKGATVYLAARSVEKAEEAIEDIKKTTGKGDIHFLPLDLQDLTSVKEAAEAFLAQETQLHQLYNNAGIMAAPPGLTKDGYEIQFGTNVIGHFALTKLLLPVMESTASKSPPGSVRIINVASAAHRRCPPAGIIFDDFQLVKKNYRSPHWRKYGQSKLGNILMSNELARRYDSKGIYSLSLHPGNVRTNIFRYTWLWQSPFGIPIYSIVSHFFFIPPEKGCLTSLYAGTSEEVVTKQLNGAFLIPYGTARNPTGYGKNKKMANDLWEYLDEEMFKQGI